MDAVEHDADVVGVFERVDQERHVERAVSVELLNRALLERERGKVGRRRADHRSAQVEAEPFPRLKGGEDVAPPRPNVEDASAGRHARTAPADEGVVVVPVTTLERRVLRGERLEVRADPLVVLLEPLHALARDFQASMIS